MTTPNDDDGHADVLVLDTARDPQPEPAPGGGDDGRDGTPPPLVPVPGDGPGDDDDADEAGADRESVTFGRDGQAGLPVDGPRPFVPGSKRDRPPVLPPWLASRAGLVASARWAVKEARYHAGFHAVRAPKYAIKTAVYAPPGAVRTLSRLAHVGQRGGG